VATFPKQGGGERAPHRLTGEERKIPMPPERDGEHFVLEDKLVFETGRPEKSLREKQRVPGLKLVGRKQSGLVEKLPAMYGNTKRATPDDAGGRTWAKNQDGTARHVKEEEAQLKKI